MSPARAPKKPKNVFIYKYLQNLSRFMLLIWSLAGARASFGNSFVIGSLQDPATLYPLFQKAGEASSIRHLTNPPILSVRIDGKILCILCKELPEIEERKSDEPGGTSFVISLELKKKMRWADGTPITPQDVKFTLETMARTEYGKGKNPLLPIKRIEIDPEQKNKIQLILTHRRADAYQLFAISLLPSHKADLIQRLYKEPRDLSWWTKLQDPGLYYGAYAVKSASAEQWQLVSNSEGTWEDAPTQDLDVKLFSNNLGNLAKALQKGEIERTAEGELNWQAYQDLKGLMPNLEEKFSVQSRPGQTLELILLNLRSPLLVNPQLRQILHHAIRRTSLVETQLQNHGAPAFTFLHPFQVNRMGDKLVDPYQPQLVTKLLEQTGSRRNAEGTLVMDGQKISLVLSCTESRMKSGIFQSVANDLRKIGIDFKIEVTSDEDFMRQTLAHRRFRDMACMRWQLPPLTPPIDLLHSLAIPSADNNFNGSNFSGWEQSGVDRILETMQKDADIGNLRRLISRLDKQFMSDLPGLPLVYVPELWLNKKADLSKASQETNQRMSLYPTPAASPEYRSM